MNTSEIETMLKDFIAESIEKLNNGKTVHVFGGYKCYTTKDRLINDYCGKIVTELYKLGYEATTNHGHGCLDYYFTKPINLIL